MGLISHFLRFALFALLALFAGTGLYAANLNGDEAAGEFSTIIVSDDNATKQGAAASEVNADHSSSARFSHFKNSLKKKIKVRGYGASFIQLSPPVFYCEKLLPKALIGGMAAYTQPYFISSQYSFLFRLTPF